LVIPVKRLAVAKTRLGDRYAVAREQLALAFALDTTTAAMSCPAVGEVVVVTDEPAARSALLGIGARVVPDEPDAGLNAALRHGAAMALRTDPSAAVGALSADLPALRGEELGAALLRAAGHDAAFVRDAAGTGTTLVLAAPGRPLQPEFGPDSAHRHVAAGHQELTGDDLGSLRRDVDTAADLEAARALGLGRHTDAALRQLAALD
jgi:2-phospho-L-lactate guanylyltransferase